MKESLQKITGKSYKDFPVVREMGLVTLWCRFRRAGIEQLSTGQLHSVFRVPFEYKKEAVRHDDLFFGASVLIGLLENLSHTNTFLNFRASNYLTFTSSCQWNIKSDEMQNQLQ